MIGTTVGSYRIVSKISDGGMGTVYRAEHELIGRPAAVKVLREELCANQEVVDRFFTEAKATTAIKHPGIVEIFDFGYMDSGHAYLTMEFLEGLTLSERCEHRGKMSEGEAAMLLRGVCSALAAAHAKGIVHRDLKPDNIFMVPDADSAIGERPKILDFGIAKLTDVGLGGSVNATKTGVVMGTPTYMSPEQCKGAGEVDHRSDLYSIGCIYYELITGKPPFTDLGAGELIGAHLFVEPALPSTLEPELSAETESLIMALLSKQPAKRPQTAKELSQRLASIAQAQGWITQSSPTGITSKSLGTLPVIARATTGRPADAREHSSPPVTTTPSRDTKPRALTPVPGDKPTTLSGAASQAFDVPKRPRSGLRIAAAATILLAGGTLAFVMFSGGADAPAKPVVTPAKPSVLPAIDRALDLETPTPTTKADTAPTPPVTVVPPPAPELKPDPPLATTPAVTKPVAATHEPTATAKPPKPAAKPTKPRAKPPTLVKPTTKPEAKPPEKKKPSLIETEID